jgi:cation:H+ antiporter
MTDPAGLFVLGLIVLGVGAELFGRGLSLAVRVLGKGRSIERVVVAAVGYSAPVLAVCLAIGLSGYPRTALATAVGANVTHVGLVLGVAATLSPLAARSRLLPAGIMILLAVSLLLLFLARDNELGRVDAIVLLILFGFVLAALLRFARGEPPGHPPVAPPKPGVGFVAAALTLAGVAGLLAGAALVARPLVGLVREAGTGGITVALTAIAPGVTVRALADAVIGSRRGEADAVLGGVVGASLVTVLLTLPVLAVASSIPVVPRLQQIELPVMALFAALLLPALATGLKVRRWEGLVLLAAYAAFIAWEVSGGRNR